MQKPSSAPAPPFTHPCPYLLCFCFVYLFKLAQVTLWTCKEHRRHHGRAPKQQEGRPP